jgi:type VI secretion system protein ImpM
MAAWAGFFGKMPTTGDFVARGLPPGLRLPLDRWLIAHVLEAGHDWPATGLRGLVRIGDRDVAFLALPSCDRLGRDYPLVALTDGTGLSKESADDWCAGVLPALTAAQAGEIDPQALAAYLADAPPPAPTGAADHGVWVDGAAPSAPSVETIGTLLSSG